VKLEGMKDAAGALAAFEKLMSANPSPAQRAKAVELMARAKQLGAK